MLKTPMRLILPEAVLLLCFAAMLIRFFIAAQTSQTTQTGVRQGNYHLHVPLTSGVIYDRNMQPLNQSEQMLCAVVNPTPEAAAAVLAKTVDPAAARFCAS